MAATQLGTDVKIGFGSNAYTGTLLESYTTEAVDGNVEEILDELGATETVVLMNPATQISFTAVILDSGGSLTPPAIGASITVNSVVYRATSSSVSQVAGASRLSLTAIKENAMTYT